MNKEILKKSFDLSNILGLEMLEKFPQKRVFRARFVAECMSNSIVYFPAYRADNEKGVFVGVTVCEVDATLQGKEFLEILGFDKFGNKIFEEEFSGRQKIDSIRRRVNFVASEFENKPEEAPAEEPTQQ